MDTDQEFEEFLEDTYAESVELAQAALDRGDDNLALELAEECLEEKQLDVEVLNICAVAATNLGDLTKAQGLFKKALQLDPRNGALHHNFAVLLDRQQEFSKAVHHLERALELQPDFPEAYINLGNVLDELGRTEEALKRYREALRRMPDSHDAYYNIGYACNRLGLHEEAVENFKKALELFPEDAGSLNGAGFALYSQGLYAEAVSFYDRAIACEPKNATYRFNRGLLHARTDVHAAALDDLSQAISCDPEFVEAYLEIVPLLADHNRFDEAEALLCRVEELDPENTELLFLRALICERQGEPEKALDYLEKSLLQDPESLQVLNNKGNLLIDLERLDEAMVCFEEIIRRQPDYALAHFNRACVFALRGEAEPAVAALRRALELDGDLWEEIPADPDFSAIKENPVFLQLARDFERAH